MKSYLSPYGDMVYEINTESELKEIENNRGIFLKSQCKIKDKNYNYLMQLDDSYIYCNNRIKDLVSMPINGKFLKILVVIVATDMEWNYVVCVKNKCHSYLTNVSGYVNPDESFEAAAFREVLEETTLDSSDIIQMEKVSVEHYKMQFMNRDFPTETHHYMMYVKLSKERINSLKKHSNDEISEIRFIKTNTVFNMKNQLLAEWRWSHLKFLRKHLASKKIRHRPNKHQNVLF